VALNVTSVRLHDRVVIVDGEIDGDYEKAGLLNPLVLTHPPARGHETCTTQV
jgi:hypothetical protein